MLKYYPEHFIFENYKKDYLDYITNLYNNYVDLFIINKKRYSDVSKEYKKFV